jgi:TPR repeat protein
MKHNADSGTIPALSKHIPWQYKHQLIIIGVVLYSILIPVHAMAWLTGGLGVADKTAFYVCISKGCVSGFYEDSDVSPLKSKNLTVEELKVLGRDGDSSARFELGLMYHKGISVSQDEKEAAKWYRLAAEQGHARAQNNLGLMYEAGIGVSQDEQEALKWYRLAADQGDPKAQNNLGMIYYKTEGADSKIIAYALFNASVSKDPSSMNPASRNATELASELSPKEIKTGRDLAQELSKPGSVMKSIDEFTQKNRTILKK